MPRLTFLECTVPLLSVSIVNHVPWAVAETHTVIHLAYFQHFLLLNFTQAYKYIIAHSSGLSNTTVSPHNLLFPRPLAHPEIFFFFLRIANLTDQKIL